MHFRADALLSWRPHCVCLKVLTGKSEPPSRLETAKRTTAPECRVQASSGKCGVHLIRGFSGAPQPNTPSWQEAGGILILVKSFGKDESSPVCPHCVKAAAFERSVGMPRSRHQNSLDLGCTYQERDSIQSGSVGWPSEVEVRDQLLVPGQRTRTLQEFHLYSTKGARNVPLAPVLSAPEVFGVPSGPHPAAGDSYNVKEKTPFSMSLTTSFEQDI